MPPQIQFLRSQSPDVEIVAPSPVSTEEGSGAGGGVEGGRGWCGVVEGEGGFWIVLNNTDGSVTCCCLIALFRTQMDVFTVHLKF